MKGQCSCVLSFLLARKLDSPPVLLIKIFGSPFVRMVRVLASEIRPLQDLGNIMSQALRLLPGTLETTRVVKGIMPASFLEKADFGRGRPVDAVGGVLTHGCAASFMTGLEEAEDKFRGFVVPGHSFLVCSLKAREPHGDLIGSQGRRQSGAQILAQDRAGSGLSGAVYGCRKKSAL